jgi:Domain of unknown function (DUF4184)
MPFTPAHAALLAPLKRTRIRITDTAFLAGAVVPDFESFLLMRNAEKFGHTTAGVFLMDLPLALLLAISFHSFIKQPLLQHLPAVFRARFEKRNANNWTDFAIHHPIVVLYSILLGTGSHLLWDAFTHEGGFFVTLIPLLQYNIKSLDYKPVFFLIQVLSSIWGTWFVWNRIQKIQPDEESGTINKSNYSYWILILLAAIIILFSRFIFSFVPLSNADWVKAAIGAIIYGIIFLSAGWSLYFRYKKRAA